jgi:hypothetical protein
VLQKPLTFIGWIFSFEKNQKKASCEVKGTWVLLEWKVLILYEAWQAGGYFMLLIKFLMISIDVWKKQKRNQWHQTPNSLSKYELWARKLNFWLRWPRSWRIKWTQWSNKIVGLIAEEVMFEGLYEMIELILVSLLIIT